MVTTDLREILRISGYGLLTWLVPFMIAIPFYSPGGTVLIDPALFKSVMVVTGAVVGAVLIIRVFRTLSCRYVFYGMLTGIIWLIVNWILDLFILVPMSGLDIPSYLSQIGLRYLMIPVMTIMAGFIAEIAVEHEHTS